MAIADRLHVAGYRVVGFDPARNAAFPGEWAETTAEVAQRCRRIVLCLPNADVSSRVLQELGDALVVDTTTGAPNELAARPLTCLDATVGGSSEQLRQGQAILMVGGAPDTFAQFRDVLQALSQQVFHVGPAGAGARMKLVFNLVLGLNRAVLAEALGFAQHTGVDPAAALEILKSGAAYSRVMDAKGAKMLSGDFTPVARLSQHLKDVRLILEAGHAAGARLPLSELHRQILESVEADGLGHADNSAVIRYFLPAP